MGSLLVGMVMWGALLVRAMRMAMGNGIARMRMGEHPYLRLYKKVAEGRNKEINQSSWVSPWYVHPEFSIPVLSLLLRIRQRV